MSETVRIRVECSRVVDRVKSYDPRIRSTRGSPRVAVTIPVKDNRGPSWSMGPADALELARKVRRHPEALPDLIDIDTRLRPCTPVEAERLASALERAVKHVKASPPVVAVTHHLGRVTAASRDGRHWITVIVEGEVIARGAWRIGLEVGEAKRDAAPDSWWFSAGFVARMADALDGSAPATLPAERRDVTIRRGPNAVRLRLYDEIIRDAGSDGWFRLTRASARLLAGLLREALEVDMLHPPVVGFRKDVIGDIAIRGRAD